MSTGIFGIGLSGLAAAQAGLVATGHNIANASTPGYHRQSVVQTAATPLLSGAGFFGQGVQVDTVVRAYSQYLDTQVEQAQAQASYYSTYHAQLSQIDNVLADANAGLSPALQDFFQAVHTVAATPADVPSRQAMLSSGDSLVAGFNSLAARFDELRTGINSQVTSAVNQINSYGKQIAALNGSIASAQIDPSQPPNDLLDQRDALVGQLNKLIGTSVLTQSDGTINVLIGNGQNLVIGKQVMTLATIPALDDAQRLDVGYNVGGTTVPLNQSSLSDGTLGGLLDFRRNELDAAQNSLGRVALGLAQTFNEQQRLGQDLNGTLGTDFFTVPVPGVLAKSNNAGNAVVTATVADAAALTISDYRLTVSVSGGVPTYSVTRLADNTTTSYAALPQTVDGVTIAIASGAVADGDSFLIEPTRNAARDIAMSLTNPTGIAAAAPIRSASASNNTGFATISAGSVNSPPPPNVNLQQSVTITFTAVNTFNVVGTGTGDPSGVAYTSGASVTYNGWTVQISGTPAVGDVFTISTNSGGVADGRNALLLARLQTQNTLAGATTSYQGAYSQLVSLVGNNTHQAQIASTVQDTLADQARQAQQSLSGVNLDEEAANLLRYQQAYQASAKLIQIAATLFQAVLDLGR